MQTCPGSPWARRQPEEPCFLRRVHLYACARQQGSPVRPLSRCGPADRSQDPGFEAKTAGVIGLYLNPPANTPKFHVDEKTATQAFDRKDRMLPLAPRARRHFEPGDAPQHPGKARPGRPHARVTPQAP